MRHRLHHLLLALQEPGLDHLHCHHRLPHPDRDHRSRLLLDPVQDEDEKSGGLAGGSGEEDDVHPDGSLPSRLVAFVHLPLCPLEHEGGDEGFLCRRHLVPRQPDPPDLPELKTQGTSCRLVQAFHIHQEVELRLMKYFSTKKNKI